MLSPQEKAGLIADVLHSTYVLPIPVLEALTAKSRGTERMSLDANMLTSTILESELGTRYTSIDSMNPLENVITQVRNSTYHLPALIHWLTDKKHGNLPADVSHIELINRLDCKYPLIKDLVLEITTHAMQNKQVRHSIIEIAKIK
jgi:hypothetical protein